MEEIRPERRKERWKRCPAKRGSFTQKELCHRLRRLHPVPRFTRWRLGLLLSPTVTGAAMEIGEVASGVEVEEWTDQWVSVWRGGRLLALGGCRVLAAAGGSFDVDGDQEIGEDRKAAGERGDGGEAGSAQELYELGARRIGFFSAPPVGCVPAQRTLARGAGRKCAENLNEAAKLFNSKLSQKLDSLGSSLPDGRFVYMDVYNILLDLIQNPKKHGFQVADKGCCGTGDIEVSILCNQYTPVKCANISDHIFWDSYHPTESAYKALVSPLLGQNLNKFF
ncbi:GDSL esterase/lipase EXL3-like [Populus alba]|uniref:GDSL esterase/lipase EXL3-like n=1 Tax=Populus alba TaxID=43335 RepID=UPI0015885D2E|nr:GDSL esterase/lipase EXL3-like [Populus alba]